MIETDVIDRAHHSGARRKMSFQIVDFEQVTHWLDSVTQIVNFAFEIASDSLTRALLVFRTAE